MKARRIALWILSILYLAVLAVCAYTPTLHLAGVLRGEVPAQAAQEVKSAADEGNPSAPPVELKVPFITPKVTLTAGSFPEDITSLTAVIVTGETALLDQFTQLKTADLTGSTCYEEIMAWAARHPEIDVTYAVMLSDGTSISSKSTSVDLSKLDGATAATLLKFLPAVKTAEIGSISDSLMSMEDVGSLQAAYPGVAFHYTVLVLGQTLDADTQSLDLSAASADDIAAVIQALPALTNLKTITLGSTGNAITWEQITAIGDACPDAVLDYNFTIWGVDANLSDAMLSLTHIKMDDGGAAVRAVLPYMRNCVGVDMDSCGVSNDAMAQIQAENPDVSVVWRIWFGTGYSVRTDVEKILASSPSRGGMLNNDNTQVLKYCTKVKYLDLGHNADLTNISFVSSMPDLEVFIIALSSVADISPLADCPKLEYLELTYTKISDLSPLAGCTELAHINLGECPVYDLSPLFGLTKLERVWLGYKTAQNISQDQIDHILAQIEPNRMDPTSPDTPREYQYPAVYGVETEAATPSEGSWKIVGYTDLSLALFDETGWLQDVLSPRYALLREQFGYDYVPNCYSLAVNDPLY